MDIISERTIALAGILQACHQVQTLARQGILDEAAYNSSIKSILVLDALNTPAVYGGIEGVRTGLRLLSDGIMQSTSADNMEILRYAMAILHLQNQIMKDSSKFQQFGSDIEKLSSYSNDELPQACSKIYQDHVSVMQPQVIVQGEETHLQKDDVPPKIRSLLLAALRSAVLWQQKGGGRFRLIWERTRMRNAARSLLSNQAIH